MLPDQCCGRCIFWDQYREAPGFGICKKWALKPLPPVPDLSNCSAFSPIPTNTPPDAAVWGKSRWGDAIWKAKE